MTDINTNIPLPFLSKVADYVLEKYPNHLREICIVFPNRRAGLFLKTHIADKLKKAFWSPTIISIEDFICEVADKKITDNIRLLIELYQIHKKIEKENSKPFDEFIRWGQILLTDFNEVDLYLSNAEDLFNYLSESKAISLWNTDGKPLTDYQHKYLHLFKSLAIYYKELSIQLSEKKMAYQGMVYRYVAENINSINFTDKWYKIIFAGFNALTTSEENIIKKLIQSNKAEILWDADKYYFENDMQEAGNLIRRNYKSIGGKEFNWLTDDYKNSIKEINIIGAVNGISQAKIAGNIIKKYYSKTDNKEINKPLNTAIVLVDENLLLPLLYSLPAEVSQLNITMGYPLKNASISSFFDIVFLLHENAKRLGNSDFSNDQNFYYKDLVKLFTHPYTLNLFGNNKKNAIETIIKRNKVFWKKEEIMALLPETIANIKDSLLGLLSDWNTQPYNSFEAMLKFIAILQKQLVEEHDLINTTKNDFNIDIELEYLYTLSKLINNLQVSIKSIAADIELKTLHSLFNQAIGLTKLPFYGEPLKGLQIMGLLETRTLDFDNLIMLSVNEGLLPSGKTNNSLIPYDIKRNFNLATYNEHDAIYAYHFYRLLQRAKHIYLLYNTQTDDFGKGERSRFINQIIYELPKYNKNIKIIESIVSSLPEKQNVDYSISIEKEDIVYTMLKEMAIGGMSPSAINTYRSCKLKFYFRYLLKLKESDDIQEKIDAVTLGNIIHESLMEIYKPFINKVINEQNLENKFQKIEMIVRQAFLNYFDVNEINYGKNYLIYRVAIKLINNFLELEMNTIERLKSENAFLTILALEKAFEKEIIQTVNNEKITINLYGKVDRIDSVANNIRIIDYKTGYFDKKEVNVKEWTDLIDKPAMDKCFQLFFYAYLAQGVFDKPIQSGIIGFKKLSDGFVNVTTENKDEYLSDKDLQSFETILLQIFSEMFDKNIPFTQTEDTERCAFCPYNMICNKE